MVAMLGVVGSLIGGIFVMTKGAEKDRRTSNKMMQLRVLCQGAAIMLLFLAYLARK